MIGAVSFRLRAENSARLPFINGRFMHAAFFKLLAEASPDLVRVVHDELNLKPFTVSFLDPIRKIPSAKEQWLVRGGDEFFWRVTGLNAAIMQAVMSIAVGDKIQAGALALTVAEARTDSIIAVNDFIAGAKTSPPITEIRFDFVSPVSFKTDKFDAPYPRPELIFTSLADKWNQASMPVSADKKIVREFAAQIRLTKWQGQSKKFYLAADRGTLAFWGNFFYDIGALSRDVQKVFVLLARFAEFAGVGRLTGQGFGQTKINFRQ